MIYVSCLQVVELCENMLNVQVTKQVTSGWRLLTTFLCQMPVSGGGFLTRRKEFMYPVGKMKHVQSTLPSSRPLAAVTNTSASPANVKGLGVFLCVDAKGSVKHNKGDLYYYCLKGYVVYVYDMCFDFLISASSC